MDLGAPIGRRVGRPSIVGLGVGAVNVPVIVAMLLVGTGSVVAVVIVAVVVSRPLGGQVSGSD